MRARRTWIAKLLLTTKTAQVILYVRTKKISLEMTSQTSGTK